MIGEWSTGRNYRRSATGFVGRALIAGAAIACGATAFGGEIIGPVFSIEARTADGRVGTYQVDYNPTFYNTQTGVYDWDSVGAVTVNDQFGNPLAEIGNVWTFMVVDPIISLGFLVTAGNADTMFTINSALLSFPAIAPAQVSASAQIGATDQNGNGVVVRGNYGGGTKSYIANYNGFVPGGTNYATLVNNQAAGAFGTTVSNEGNPAGGGFNNVAGPITSMSASFSFTLSAGDSAGGTSVFVVVPEPSSVLLLVFGAAAGLLRRR